MSIRTSNQVSHIPNKAVAAISTSTPTKRADALGRVGMDCLATLTVDDAIAVECRWWHEQSQTWRLAGYDVTVYKVTFEALGSYSWTIPEDALVHFKNVTGGSVGGYHDLCAWSNT